MVTVLETLRTYPLFDVAILHHGFTPYMRDYALIVEANWQDGATGRYHYYFTHCVEVECKTVLKAETLQNSWGDEFIYYERWEREGSPSGHVWGVNWSLAYPGWDYIAESSKARAWSESLGKTMHEVSVETNVYVLHLVFHALQVRKVDKNTSLA